MTFDRSLLAVLVLTMIARLTHSPAHICETLSIVSALQLWRLRPKALRVGAASVVSVG
jgi:hypothetical protein